MARFGLQLPNFGFGTPDSEMFQNLVDRARAAEESGFESVWVMDHFYQLPALGGPEQPMLECYTLLGALAAATSTAKLGALVTGVTYRNPAMLAKQITTLDVISGGRAILGIGAAWHDTEHHAFGWDFPSDRERLARLDEAVQICKGMLTQETTTFEGTYYRVKDVRNVPRPIQDGGPPIMIGGGGEKVTLRLVAKYADMCNIGGSLDIIRRKLDALKRHCEDLGRDPKSVVNSRLSTLIITDSDEQTEQVRAMLEQAAGPETAAGFTFGQEGEVLDQVAQAIEAGIDYFTFNMPFGTPDDVRRAGALLTSKF